MTTRPLLTLVSLAALAVLPARAQTRVDERRPAQPDGVVSIDNATGTLKITGWDKAEVAVTGRLGANAEGVTIESHGKRTTIEVELAHGPQAEAELEISVPAGSDVEVDGFSADSSVAGVKGAVRIETVNGSISVVAAGGELELHTVNGPIDVSGSSPRASVAAVNGAVTLKGVSGEVEASSVNGKLTVAGGSFKRGEFQTVAGPLHVQCDLAPGARLEAHSVSGSVELLLPASVSAAFSVTSFSGDIDNELGPPAEKSSKWTSQKSLAFTAGSGSASVEVQTLSGHIALRKR